MGCDLLKSLPILIFYDSVVGTWHTVAPGLSKPLPSNQPRRSDHGGTAMVSSLLPLTSALDVETPASMASKQHLSAERTLHG